MDRMEITTRSRVVNGDADAHSLQFWLPDARGGAARDCAPLVHDGYMELASSQYGTWVWCNDGDCHRLPRRLPSEFGLQLDPAFEYSLPRELQHGYILEASAPWAPGSRTHCSGCGSADTQPVPNLIDVDGVLVVAELRGFLMRFMINTKEIAVALINRCSADMHNIRESQQLSSKIIQSLLAINKEPYAREDDTIRIRIALDRIEFRLRSLVKRDGTTKLNKHLSDQEHYVHMQTLLSELDLLRTAMVLTTGLDAVEPARERTMYITAVGCTGVENRLDSHYISMSGFASHLSGPDEYLLKLLVENDVRPHLGPFGFRCFMPGCRGVIFASAINCLPKTRREHIQQFLYREFCSRRTTSTTRTEPEIAPSSLPKPDVLDDQAMLDVVKAIGEGAVRRCPAAQCMLPYIYVEGQIGHVYCPRCGTLWCYSCGKVLSAEDLARHRRPGQICPKRLTHSTEGRMQRTWTRKRFADLRDKYEALRPGLYRVAISGHWPIVVSVPLYSALVKQKSYYHLFSPSSWTEW